MFMVNAMRCFRMRCASSSLAACARVPAISSARGLLGILEAELDVIEARVHQSFQARFGRVRFRR